MTTFVSVGNATQPFSRLLSAVVRLAPTLPQPVVIQHGTTQVDSTYCDCRHFVSMAEFETLISSAELLILHAGAGSVIHAVRAGKVPVLMPRRAQFGELIDDHQTEFARALEASGRVIVINDPSQLGKAVQRALEVQREMVVNSKVSRMTRLIEGTLARYATLSR